jgi:hypothetical protein
MRIIGFVELTPDLSSEVFEGLAVGAYRMSRNGTVALSLNGVSADMINRPLDCVVRAERCASSGVWYLDGHVVTDRLLDLASQATFVVAVSDDLSLGLDRRGIARVGLRDGLRHLGMTTHRPRDRDRLMTRRSSQRGTLTTS